MLSRHLNTVSRHAIGTGSFKNLRPFSVTVKTDIDRLFAALLWTAMNVSSVPVSVFVVRG